MDQSTVGRFAGDNDRPSISPLYQAGPRVEAQPALQLWAIRAVTGKALLGEQRTDTLFEELSAIVLSSASRDHSSDSPEHNREMEAGAAHGVLKSDLREIYRLPTGRQDQLLGCNYHRRH